MFVIVAFAFSGLSLVNGLYNVALHKTASQIDTYFNGVHDFNPDNAIDGNYEQVAAVNGSIAHTLTQDGAWWKVDLEDIYIIDSIKIWNRVDVAQWRLANVEVYTAYSDVESDYVLRGYHGGQINGTHTFPMAGVAYGRMVKITRRFFGFETLNLCEVEVFGTDINDDVFDYVANVTGTSAVLVTKWSRSSVHCCSICLKTSKCAAVNYFSVTKQCDLLESTTTAPTNSGIGRFYKYPNL